METQLSHSTLRVGVRPRDEGKAVPHAQRNLHFFQSNINPVLFRSLVKLVKPNVIMTEHKGGVGV